MKIEGFEIPTQDENERWNRKHPLQYQIQIRKSHTTWFEHDAQFDNLPDALRYAISTYNQKSAHNVRIIDRETKAIVMTYPPITLRSELDPQIVIPDLNKRFKATFDEYETALSPWAKYQMAKILNAEAARTQTWFREGSRRYTLDAGVLKCAFRKLYPKF